MSAISRLHNAFMSIPQELTVAAANFNLDFSLMKVEAPKEYHGLRDALSTHRRDDAEEGTAHVTARKLGALFEAKVPKIQHLIEAYGKRVSAISSRSTNEAKKQHDYVGIFAAQAGPDGTSIWAAATSGQAALALHLLAYMLARIWKSHEATSIWVELVDRRKQEINDTYNNTNVVETAAMMAAWQEFSRKQLAALDASARSWLRTADADRKQQQTQLMLIVNNVNVSANSKKDPYESVLEAWTSGMCAMESMVKGIPQQVRNGAVLLAMSAWHLYPEMEVLADETKHINQHDDLMNGALLTISRFAASDNQKGVFWSLPLARMRYYSPPVVTKRLLASETSRVSMAELWTVALGNLIGQWTDLCSEHERLCKTIIRLSSLVNQPRISIVWLHCLAKAANKYNAADSADGQHYRRLFGLGMRLRNSWLNEPAHMTTDIFGLCSFRTLLDTFGADEKIIVMRQIAETLGAPLEDLVIRYPAPEKVQEDYIPSRSPSLAPMEEEQEEEQASRYCWFKFASIRLSSSSRPVTPSSGEDEPSAKRQRHATSSVARRGSCVANAKHQKYAGRRHGSHTRGGLTEHYDFPGAQNVRHIYRSHFWLVQSDKQKIRYDLVLGDPDNVAIFSKKKDCVLRCQAPSKVLPTIDEIGQILSFPIHSDRLLNCFNRMLSGGRVYEFGAHQQWLSLFALSHADNLYQGLEKATISIEIVNQPIYQALWARMALGLDGHGKTLSATQQQTSRERKSAGFKGPQEAPFIEQGNLGAFLYDEITERTENVPSRKRDVPRSRGLVSSRHLSLFHQWLAVPFACIAMFESGEFNIDPEYLGGVMALSTEDSIYVASHLVSDPCPKKDTYQHPVRRVFGNLGRPENAFLVPPSTPKLKDYDPKSWHLINHMPFDGNLENKFEGTSLHLSFTDYEFPVDVGAHGLRDTLVNLVESVVSVNHKGLNLGDLDILSVYRSKLVTMIRGCGHSSTGEAAQDVSQLKLTSVDSWEEFFDYPLSAEIVRASGNWQARLAIAAASVQRGHRTLILPQEPCLQCLRKFLKESGPKHIKVIVA